MTLDELSIPFTKNTKSQKRNTKITQPVDPIPKVQLQSEEGKSLLNTDLSTFLI